MAKIYNEIHEELKRQLNNIRDSDNIPSIYPIGCNRVISLAVDPKKLSDDDLPAVAYKLGTRIKDDSITTTTSLKGYRYSVAVHATLLKTDSLKMMETMDIISMSLRNVAADDGSKVRSCEVLVVDNLLKNVLTTRDHLLFQFAFETVVQA